MGLNVKLRPEEVWAMLEAGYLLAERREYAKAKEVFEGMEALGHGADVAQLGLASVLLIEGNAKEAEKALRAAVKNNPKFALAHAQLGEILYTQGKKEDALASLKQAEDLEPKGPAGEYARWVRQAANEGTVYKYQVPGGSKGSGGKKK